MKQDIKDMKLGQLKALAYDLIVQRERNAQELNIVNQYILNYKEKDNENNNR